MYNNIDIYSDSLFTSDLWLNDYNKSFDYIIAITLLMFWYNVSIYVLIDYKWFIQDYDNFSIKQYSHLKSLNKKNKIIIKLEEGWIDIKLNNKNIAIDKNIINDINWNYFIAAYIWAKLSWLEDENSYWLWSKFLNLSKKYWNIDKMYNKYNNYNNFNFFIIWPSGSWKSTFINTIKKNALINNYNDLRALNEVFNIDSDIYNLDDSDILFFSEYYDKRKKWLINKFTCYNWDWYDIINSDVWDQILINTLKTIDYKYINLIEFSRWYDFEHSKKHKYKADEVYLYFFNLIEDFFKKKSKNIKPIFIFLDCWLENRLHRNNIRKKEWKHYISEKTMNEIYYESFIPLENNFILNNNKNYILYKIDNENNSLDIDKVFEFKYNKILALEKLRSFLE